MEKFKQLEAENKALKERDWEECCEEVKVALRTEIKSLEKSRHELYKAFKAWQVTEDWLPSERMLGLLEDLRRN